MTTSNLLSVKEFASLIGFHEEHVRALIRQGHIAVVRMTPRGRLFIPEDEVRRLLTPKRRQA